MQTTIIPVNAADEKKTADAAEAKNTADNAAATKKNNDEAA